MKSYGIYESIENDEELLKLYLNDSTFHKSIYYGYHQEWSNEKILIFALKKGYEAKEIIQNEYIEYIKTDCRPIIIGDKKYSFPRFGGTLGE